MGFEPDTIPLPLVNSPSPWLDRVHCHAGGFVHRVGRGRILLHEGERSSCLWVLQSGAVTLATTARSGRRATLAVLGPGAVLREHGLVDSLIDPRQRGTTIFPEIRTLIASTVQVIPLAGLQAAMATDPSVACWLAAAVIARAIQVERTLARVLATRVPQRVSGALHDLALEFGEVTPGSVRIGLPITQDLLASMTGATRESVNRAIAELEERGLVRRMGLRYELLVGGGAS